MKLEVPNPVGCAVCVNLGDFKQRAETIVRGYATCNAHSMLIDQHDSIADAIKAVRGNKTGAV